MTALSAERNTPKRGGLPILSEFYLPVAATTKIFKGSMVAIDASGNAVPASASSALRVIGRAIPIDEVVDNSAGAAGDLSVRVERGVFRWVNGDSITKSSVGDIAYASDDQTVNKADGSGARPEAGRIVDVDAVGVWVETLLDPSAPTLAAGEYTATLTAVTNVAAAVHVTARYARIGNTVFVEFACTIDVTTTGATELGISLPIASDLAATADLSGSAHTKTVGEDQALIEGDATANRASLTYTAIATGVVAWNGRFAYTVK